MEITLELDKADWHRFMAHVEKVAAAKSGNSGFVSLAYWFVLAVLFMWMFQDIESFHGPTAFTVVVFFVLICVFYFLRVVKMRKAIEPTTQGVFVGKHEFVFDADGISSKGLGYQCFHAWSAIKGVERAGDMILIYLDTAFAFVFPEGKLENADDFFRSISELHKTAVAS